MSLAQKPFPYDRVNNFSDAIFAIGITLLVLEIKVPTATEISELGVSGLLNKRIPYFIGYFVSFMVTALYWKSHLQLFQLVKSIDNKLLWLNLWLLFFVVLLPFSTALYSYFFNFNNAFSFYTLNLAAMGIMTYWMMVYVSKKENLEEVIGGQQVKWMKNRALISPLIFILSIPVTLILPWIGRVFFVLIFVLQAIGDRRLRRKTAGPSGD
jgi:uncharacterized membrane protein